MYCSKWAASGCLGVIWDRMETAAEQVDICIAVRGDDGLVAAGEMIVVWFAGCVRAWIGLLSSKIRASEQSAKNKYEWVAGRVSAAE